MLNFESSEEDLARIVQEIYTCAMLNLWEQGFFYAEDSQDCQENKVESIKNNSLSISPT